MKKLAMIAVLAAVLSVSVGAAMAELCNKCSDMMFIMSVGTCTKCGAGTSSGAFKLCGACSKKLDQCEHCLASLKAPATAPATGPATQPSTQPATAPATRPAPRL